MQYLKSLVSIHAPVTGATQERHQCRRRDVVSIHAPVTGATGLQEQLAADVGVSIHAPVTGATARALRLWQLRLCFNPRARDGRDMPQ